MTAERPTPETDMLDQDVPIGKRDGIYIAMRTLSRRLERERNEARERITKLERFCDKLRLRQKNQRL